MSATVPLFTAPCPGCGAALDFRSPASVMAVCGYCQTTALRDADSLRDMGKMSQILDDLSPLQIGVTGIFEGRGFTLLGRLQMTYAAGRWSEWFAWFDDGSEGWLSEASGQYVFTRDQGKAANAPPFEGMRPGALFFWEEQPFRATDVRRAACIGGQGEIPFRVGDGWEASTADFRQGDRFLTLDYSDGSPPECYAGRAVTLAELQCQLLRDTDQIVRDSGKQPGKIQSLDCPNCGSPIQYAAGMTDDLVCPACQAEVALAGDKATVLAVHRAVSGRTTLQLGEVANFNGASWTLIGYLQARETGEDVSSWTEYLLFNPQKGFHWLVESDEGWESVEVLNSAPDLLDSQRVRYRDQTLTLAWNYGAEVTFAAGAFNWRVHVGDRTALSDFTGAGGLKLSRETTEQEITWSLARRETAATVLGWFGRKPRPTAARVLRPAGAALAREFKGFSIALWVINLPLILMGKGSLIVTLIAWGVLWVFSRTGDNA